jgi:hypothetical protein
MSTWPPADTCPGQSSRLSAPSPCPWQQWNRAKLTVECRVRTYCKMSE